MHSFHIVVKIRAMTLNTSFYSITTVLRSTAEVLLVFKVRVFFPVYYSVRQYGDMNECILPSPDKEGSRIQTADKRRTQDSNWFFLSVYKWNLQYCCRCSVLCKLPTWLILWAQAKSIRFVNIICFKQTPRLHSQLSPHRQVDSLILRSGRQHANTHTDTDTHKHNLYIMTLLVSQRPRIICMYNLYVHILPFLEYCDNMCAGKSQPPCVDLRSFSLCDQCDQCDQPRLVL